MSRFYFSLWLKTIPLCICIPTIVLLLLFFKDLYTQTKEFSLNILSSGKKQHEKHPPDTSRCSTQDLGSPSCRSWGRGVHPPWWAHLIVFWCHPLTWEFLCWRQHSAAIFIFYPVLFVSPDTAASVCTFHPLLFQKHGTKDSCRGGCSALWIVKWPSRFLNIKGRPGIPPQCPCLLTGLPNQVWKCTFRAIFFFFMNVKDNWLVYLSSWEHCENICVTSIIFLIVKIFKHNKNRGNGIKNSCIYSSTITVLNILSLSFKNLSLYICVHKYTIGNIYAYVFLIQRILSEVKPRQHFILSINYFGMYF